MGDCNHYTSEIFKLNQTIDLAQACETLVQVRKGNFKHLPVTGILGRLELLKDSPTGQFNRLPLLPLGGLVEA
jgi:hypothetical protein